MAFLAGLDNFVIVVPTDGLLISSTLLAPRKWFRFWLLTAVGSSLGALGVAALIQVFGFVVIQNFFPSLVTSSAWIWTESFFHQYGLWLLLFVAATPLVQHPAIILSVLAKHPLGQIFLVIFLGRLFKYFVMTWAARYAPAKLSKLWGVQDEIQQVEELVK